MTYYDGEYPKLPSFGMSLRTVSRAVLLGWLTRTDWYDLRRSLREAFSSLWWALVWFLVWIVTIGIGLLAPVSIPVYMFYVRRQQKKVLITKKRRWLRNRLQEACRGYSWS